MNSLRHLIHLSVLLLWGLGVQQADAYRVRASQVPSNSWGCSLCHVSPYGGGPRTVFGNDVFTFGRDGRNMEWANVCELDSDGDGSSNGAELGDPDCLWRRTAEQLSIMPTDPNDAADFPQSEMMGGEAMGGEAMAGEAMAGEAMAGEAMAGEAMAGEEVAGEAMGGEATAGEAMAGEAMAGEAMAGEAMAGEAMAGEAMAGEAMAGEAMGGEATAGEAMAGEAMAGEAMAGEAMAGEAMAGEAMIDPCIEACQYIVDCSIELCVGYDDSSRDALHELCANECNPEFAGVAINQRCDQIVSVIRAQDSEYEEGCIAGESSGEEMAGEEMAGEEMAGEEMAGEEGMLPEPDNMENTSSKSDDSGCHSLGARHGSFEWPLWLLSFALCGLWINHRRLRFTDVQG